LLTDWSLRLTLVALDAFELTLVGVSDDQSPVLAQPLKKAVINIAAYNIRIRSDLSMRVLQPRHVRALAIPLALRFLLPFSVTTFYNFCT
jgi:hypothetical protein